jgi:hypothetical protein
MGIEFSKSNILWRIKFIIRPTTCFCIHAENSIYFVLLIFAEIYLLSNSTQKAFLEIVLEKENRKEKKKRKLPGRPGPGLPLSPSHGRARPNSPSPRPSKPRPSRAAGAPPSLFPLWPTAGPCPFSHSLSLTIGARVSARHLPLPRVRAGPDSMPSSIPGNSRFPCRFRAN